MVVKLGGEAITDPEVCDALLTDLVYLEQVGIRPVLVHGGGASITQAMEDAQLDVQWHEGRRVTGGPAMAIVEREVAKLNRMLVDRIFELGGAAVGLLPDRHPVVRGDARRSPRSRRYAVRCQRDSGITLWFAGINSGGAAVVDRRRWYGFEYQR